MSFLLRNFGVSQHLSNMDYDNNKQDNFSFSQTEQEKYDRR